MAPVPASSRRKRASPVEVVRNLRAIGDAEARTRPGLQKQPGGQPEPPVVRRSAWQGRPAGSERRWRCRSPAPSEPKSMALVSLASMYWACRPIASDSPGSRLVGEDRVDVDGPQPRIDGVVAADPAVLVFGLEAERRIDGEAQPDRLIPGEALGDIPDAVERRNQQVAPALRPPSPPPMRDAGGGAGLGVVDLGLRQDRRCRRQRPGCRADGSARRR